jgi:hypothetical protein
LTLNESSISIYWRSTFLTLSSNFLSNLIFDSRSHFFILLFIFFPSFQLLSEIVEKETNRIWRVLHSNIVILLTRPAWAGFKTAEEGRAKICKFLWQKLKNKSNIEKHIMNNFRTLLEQFYNSFRTLLELF